MNGQETQTTCEELLPGIIKKPWGHERIIENNGLYVVKELYVRSGCKLSLQYHKRKIETLFLVAGDGFIQFKEHGKLVFFAPMKFVPKFVGRRCIHRLGAGGHDALFVEVSTTELDDVVRLEDDYGRTST
jgi:mannose-6-phosphate isomerase-like protein (cupin superfamily)